MIITLPQIILNWVIISLVIHASGIKLHGCGILAELQLEVCMRLGLANSFSRFAFIHPVFWLLDWSDFSGRGIDMTSPFSSWSSLIQRLQPATATNKVERARSVWLCMQPFTFPCLHTERWGWWCNRSAISGCKLENIVFRKTLVENKSSFAKLLEQKVHNLKN